MEENLFMPDSIRTFTGQYINLKDPEPTTIFPMDIAVHLSRICRFNGATKKWYSVAEHSVWCAQMCEEVYPNDQWAAFKVLMHDAHEYVLYDIASPIKSKLVGYGSIATKLQNAIEYRFRGFASGSDRELIKKIDRMALEWEWQHKVLSWTGLELPPTASAEVFLEKFKQLCQTPFVIQP
jgi:hypothetical protein